MNKKVLLGSVLVLTSLLLMPSYPAIQHKTIENKSYNDLFNQLDLKDVKEFKMLVTIMLPAVHFIVKVIFIFRLLRAWVLYELSTSEDDYGWVVTHPRIYQRSIWLIETSEFIYFYLNAMFGW